MPTLETWTRSQGCCSSSILKLDTLWSSASNPASRQFWSLLHSTSILQSRTSARSTCSWPWPWPVGLALLLSLRILSNSLELYVAPAHRKLGLATGIIAGLKKIGTDTKMDCLMTFCPAGKQSLLVFTLPLTASRQRRRARVCAALRVRSCHCDSTVAADAFG